MLSIGVADHYAAIDENLTGFSARQLSRHGAALLEGTCVLFNRTQGSQRGFLRLGESFHTRDRGKPCYRLPYKLLVNRIEQLLQVVELQVRQ